MIKYKGARFNKSKSRKRSFGETKPNFNSLVKQEKDNFINKNAALIKETDPPLYYSLINRKLPKKYQKEEKVRNQIQKNYIIMILLQHIGYFQDNIVILFFLLT